MPAAILGDPNSMSLRRNTLLLALASISIGAGSLRADADAAAEVQVESIVSGVLTADELAALANEVNLPAWTQLAITRNFTTIEEGWASVYSPRDAVGVARDWSAQVKMARLLTARANKATQRRWLELFIKAGEAVSRNDAIQFTAALRAMESESSPDRIAFAASRNFFTAK